MNRAVALAALVAASGTVSAATLTFNGALSATDPTFNRPTSATALSGVGTAVAYDVFTFTADVTGPYSVIGDYTAGGVGSATGLDGYLYIYTAFNPAAGLANLVARRR
jgi:hypothetical protein